MLIPVFSPISDRAYSYLGNNSSTTNGASFTFSGESLGASDSTRVVVVPIGYTGGFDVSSVTIGGISANVALQTNNSSCRIALAYASVPNGSTGDIVVNLAGSVSNLAIYKYRLVGLSAASINTSDTVSGSTLALTNTVDVPNDGIVISLRNNWRVSVDVAFSWSGTIGVSEDAEMYVESELNLSAASIKVSSVVSSGTAICTADNATANQTQLTAVFY